MADSQSRFPWMTREVLRRVIYGCIAFGLLVAAIVSFHLLEGYLIENPRFAVREPPIYGEHSPGIIVQGLEHASLNRVMQVFAEDTGISLYLLPIDQRRRGLLAVDWVRDASVSRIWPNRVEVRIMERQPAAYIELPRRRGTGVTTALIDREGVILEKPSRLEERLPVITGIREEQSEENRAVRVRRALALVVEIGDLEKRISRVDVSDPGNLSVEASTGGQAVVLQLGRDRYRDKLVSFYQNWPEIHRRLPEAVTFDLRLDDRITAMDGVEK